MKTTIIFALLLLASLCAAGWERTYGGIGNDAASSVDLGQDRGYIITGYRSNAEWEVDTTIFGSDTLYDSTLVQEALLYTMKFDENGDSIWMQIYDTDYYDSQKHPRILRKTGIGYGLYYEDWSDFYLIGINNHGDELWRSSVFSGHYRDFSTTTDGFVFTGGAGGYMLLDKRDSLCNPEWIERYGGTDDGECGLSVLQTSDGGYIISGTTRTWGDYPITTWVVKTDSLGAALWVHLYGANGAKSIIETNDGGFAFIEDSHVLYRTDSVGDTIWTKYFGANLRECHQTNDSGYVVIGYNSSAFIAKVDVNGDSVWSRLYGETGGERAYSGRPTPDGGFILAGVWNFFGNRDIYIIKTDSLGYTGIGEYPDAAKPEAFAISAYPNPFNSAVSISFDCGSESPQALSTLPPGACRVEIFDLAGRMVAEIPADNPVGSRPASTAGDAGVAPTVHEIVWQPDATVGSGVYLVRAKVGDSGVTKRVVYLK